MTVPAVFPEIVTPDGARRQVLAESADLMVVSFRFAAGGKGSLHSHPHVQSTFCATGRFRFTVGDQTFEIGPGDGLIIPSGVTHGCICIEAGQLVDSFTPRRDEFL